MSDFNLVDLKPEPFAYVSRACSVAEMPKFMSEAFCALDEALKKANAAPTGGPFAHYRSVRNGHVEVDVGFPVAAATRDALAAAGLELGQTASGKAMHGLHVGAYEGLAHFYDAIIAELRDQGLTPAEDMWERYLDGPEVPPEKTRTEVFWPAA
jgi:effector-binding domain-containing protein